MPGGLSSRRPSGLCLLLLALLVGPSCADSSCQRAPSAAARVVCQQLHTWDANVRRRHHHFSFQQSQSSQSSSSSAASSSSSSVSRGSDGSFSQHHSSSQSSSHRSSSSSSSVSMSGHSVTIEVEPSPDLFHIETNNEFQSPNNAAFVRPATTSAGSTTEAVELEDSFLVRNKSDPLQCIDIKCLCPFIKGTYSQRAGCVASDGSVLGRVVRKEYRQMTDSERSRFHTALNRLKTKGVFDRFVEDHADSERSGGAHSGPAFLPWHREFLKRVEIALRVEDPPVALPYWDSTMDECLQNPEESVLFSDDFVGSVDARSGYVAGGPFSNWITVEARRPLRRQPGRQGRLFMEADIDAVLGQTSVERVMAYTAPQESCSQTTDWSCLEYTHGNVHVWVGGDMFSPPTSANDPLFLLHHAFVDLIWEEWRRRHQTRQQRELQYPSTGNENCSSVEHSERYPMHPFSPFRNLDGLSNAYTDELYEYADRPSCARTSSDNECQSRYLFCDISRGLRRCAPKLRDGAACTKYGDRGCLSGHCNEGRCATTTRRTTVTTRTNSFANLYKPNRQKTTSCFNENECCAIWKENGECQKNEAYMREWCKASCGICQPNYDLSVDCADRHGFCRTWTTLGECTRNPLWMNENCRLSCGRCALTRKQTCVRGY
uniref:Tyrosinase_Cu-bd domain-containing protein n=1 Tax=Steinernema glaseri TaxID=37863 RepID=A0A1I8AHN4_9BILA